MSQVKSLFVFFILLFLSQPNFLLASEKVEPAKSKDKMLEKAQEVLSETREKLQKWLLSQNVASKTEDLITKFKDLKNISLPEIIDTLDKLGASFPIDIQALQRWEYKVTEIESNDLIKLENELMECGKNGWECFFVQPYQDNKNRFFFKRRSVKALKVIFLIEAVLKLFAGEVKNN